MDNQFTENFVDEAELVDTMKRGNEVEFTYNDRNYALFRIENDKYMFCEAYIEDSEVIYDTPEELLGHVIDDKQIREILQDMKVTFRAL